MKRRSYLPLLMIGILSISGYASAQAPSAETIVQRAISAVELESNLAEHDMIRSAIRQEETASDGSTSGRDMTAILHGARLENIRLELGQGVTVVMNGGTGWAMMRGQLDERAQTPRMAAGTIRQTVFPLMLPYSLRMSGVQYGLVTEGSFDGTPAWVLEIAFDSDFFVAPSMLTKWNVYFSQKDAKVLAAEFLPAEQFRSVQDEGIRYRMLKTQNVDGLVLPSQVLLDGIDLDGVETGHVRVTKIDPMTAGPLDLALFVHPDEQAKLDAGEVE